jgi:hypothetical protein
MIVLAKITAQASVVISMPPVVVEEIEIKTEAQVTVVIIQSAHTNRNKRAPGYPFEVFAVHIIPESVSRHNKRGLTYQYEIYIGAVMVIIINPPVIPIQVICRVVQPKFEVGVSIVVIDVMPVVIVTVCEPGTKYQNC